MIVTEKIVTVTDAGEKATLIKENKDYTLLHKKMEQVSGEKATLIKENKDYTLLHKKMEANNATMIEYYITLDMAKHKPFQMRLSNRRKH